MRKLQLPFGDACGAAGCAPHSDFLSDATQSGPSNHTSPPTDQSCSNQFGLRGVSHTQQHALYVPLAEGPILVQ